MQDIAYDGQAERIQTSKNRRQLSPHPYHSKLFSTSAASSPSIAEKLRKALGRWQAAQKPSGLSKVIVYGIFSVQLCVNPTP